MNKYHFKLYVTGRTVRSERAISTMKRLCEEYLGERYEMVIIDVLEWPNLAEEDKVLATPTLIKQTPPPTRRLIGDLSDKERVLHELDVMLGPARHGGDPMTQAMGRENA